MMAYPPGPLRGGLRPPVPVGPETGLKLPSWANCTQVFTLDKARLQTRLGCVPAATLESIGGALAATLGLAQS